ncbi:MAG: bifunctional heptose 7-phosphate kinase/heptose 1-phosphate adenyltransferase [Bryobacteraceae bacterium]
MTTAEILAQIPKLSALVIGDICLDRWCFYDPAEAEPSRETGLPRLGVVATEVTPGAGGTVANNLAAMGVGRVAVIGAVGDDGFAYELRKALADRSIDGSRLVVAPGIQTFTYSKLINLDNGVEDLPRVDFVTNIPLDKATERKVLEHVHASLDEFDLIFVADQAETSRGGVVTEGLRDLLADLAPSYPEKIFLADSRQRVELFRGLILKPNQHEAKTACTKLFGSVNFAELRRQTESKLLIVTRGGDGVVLVTEEGEQRVPTRKVPKPVDICGAGDSFSAAAGAALFVSRSPETAARFGNLAASVTICKRGTGTASPEELIRADAAC